MMFHLVIWLFNKGGNMVTHPSQMYSSVSFRAKSKRISESEKDISFIFPLVEKRDFENLEQIGPVGKAIIEALNTFSENLLQAIIGPSSLHVCYRGTIEDAKTKVLEVLQYEKLHY